MTSARTGDKSKNGYMTPLWLFDLLKQEFNFSLDVCADENNNLCDTWFDEEIDGLKQNWQGVCWCNPPYSTVSKWIEKAYNEVVVGRVETAVLLTAARTDTRWFWKYAREGEIRLLPGRLKFDHPDGAKHAAPFPSCLIIFKKILYPQNRVVFWDVKEKK